MSLPSSQLPRLDRFYRDYLRSEDTASFIQSITDNYTIETLIRLSARGRRITRRAAILALGFVGDIRCNHALGRAMHDADRAVRLLAENGIRNVWMRDGNAEQRRELTVIDRLLNASRFPEAIDRADVLIRLAPGIAEVWNQRGNAWYGLDHIDDSVEDFQKALELNAYHFPAAVGLAHCHLERNDAAAALFSLRRALRLNPGLDHVRIQIEFLERSLKKK